MRTVRLVLDMSFVYWSTKYEKVEGKCPSLEDCQSVLKDLQVRGVSKKSPRQLDSRLFMVGCGEQVVTEIPGFHPLDKPIVPDSPALKYFVRSPRRYVRCVMDVNYGLWDSLLEGVDPVEHPSRLDCETHLSFWYQRAVCVRFHRGFWLEEGNLGVESWVGSWGVV